MEDRYKVVRTGFWWRVKVGDGQQTIGRCYTETEAQRLAAALLTAFRDGQFVEQNRADLLAEDIECLHMCLDDAGIPRAEHGGNVYSMWGRVQQFRDRREGMTIAGNGAAVLGS